MDYPPADPRPRCVSGQGIVEPLEISCPGVYQVVSEASSMSANYSVD